MKPDIFVYVMIALFCLNNMRVNGILDRLQKQIDELKRTNNDRRI